MDAICLLVSVNRAAKTQELSGSGLPNLLRMEWAVPEEMKLLKTYYSDTGAGEEVHDTLVYLFWLHVVTQRLEFGLEIKPDEIERFVTSIIHEFDVY